MMDTAFEQQVRERAYQLWMAGGRENGLAESHWLSAERAMMNEVARPRAKVAAPKAAALKAAAPKAASTGVKKAAKPRADKAAPTVTVRKRAKAKPDIHA